ncbi:MAG: imidazole glycerol phosphate synthase subunit HisH [Clostridia bacterium]|nr:imidazole glycerol phosphate synthase subunit HisH [Clostridia bacterium]
MIAIIYDGCGNLFSLSSSLESLGIECKITSDKTEIENADKIILPGVGAFADAAKKLKDSGLGKLVCDLAAQGKPILGICLGMQMLFEKSFEYGAHMGLGLIKGYVGPLEGQISKDLKIPHMGWNKLNLAKADPIFKYTQPGDYMYFVHSFYARNCVENTLAFAEYGVAVPAIVKNGNVYGMQFHPEKSGAKGLALLKAFSEIGD